MSIDLRFSSIALAIGVVAVGAVAVACAPGKKDMTQQTVQRDSVKSTPVAAERPSVPAVLFIGTSLTAGYGLQPEQAYPALVERMADSAGVPIKAVNAGVSGETSAGALRRISWVLRIPADIVVIETGANDALRALPVSAAKANIEAIVDSVKKAKPSARVLLVQMEAPPNLGQSYTRPFHDMYGEIARDKGITLIPFLLSGVAGKPALTQPDGLHPNAEGEQIVASNIWEALEPIVRPFES